jgi:hypothetical protein
MRPVPGAGTRVASTVFVGSNENCTIHLQYLKTRVSWGMLTDTHFRLRSFDGDRFVSSSTELSAIFVLYSFPVLREDLECTDLRLSGPPVKEPVVGSH